MESLASLSYTIPSDPCLFSPPTRDWGPVHISSNTLVNSSNGLRCGDDGEKPKDSLCLDPNVEPVGTRDEDRKHLEAN